MDTYLKAVKRPYPPRACRGGDERMNGIDVIALHVFRSCRQGRHEFWQGHRGHFQPKYRSDGVSVPIDSGVNPGSMCSFRRGKEDIEDMGNTRSGLKRLRAITFRYKKAFDEGSADGPSETESGWGRSQRALSGTNAQPHPAKLIPRGNLQTPTRVRIGAFEKTSPMRRGYPH